MLGLLLVLAAAGGAWWYLSGQDETDDPTAEASPTPTGSADPQDVTDGIVVDSPFEEHLAATADAGMAQVKIRLDAVMPPSLDHGVPERRLKGSGVAAGDLSAATLTYKLADAPNGAGVFGHVEGDIDVVHTQDRMLFTFKILRKVLADEGEWMSYDLPFLSSEFLFDVGVGQLRELALADPRIGLGLLRGVAEPAAETTEDDIGGTPVTVHEVKAGTLEAGEALPELGPLFTAMWESVHLRYIPMTVHVDDQDRIRRLDYEMVFPAKYGKGKVRLDLRLDLVELGVAEEPELPPEEDVVTYEEHFLNQDGSSPTESPSPSESPSPTDG